ncbi:MAG: peptidase domain protein [Verrucomicrobia bacterium]|nr:peptidase domain protein [Verrucomicrobiota bacterium]
MNFFLSLLPVPRSLPRASRLLLLAACSVLLAAGTAFAQIAPKVVRSKIAGVDVLIYRTGVQDVVTIKGSLPAGDAMCASGNVALATLCGQLLDQGTTKQSKFAIAEKLERVGATIEFNVGSQSLEISAKCLKQDVPLVIGLIAEELRHPAFSEEEFTKAKAQVAGTIQRQAESTDYRATEAFKQAVYSPGHPNRDATSDEFLAALESAKLDDVKAFHAKYFGPAHCTLVLVGDVDAPVIEREVATAFAGWTGGADYLRAAKSTGTDAPREQTIFMADKTSVSVIIGQPSGLHYGDPDYVALRAATSILGSDFTSRLVHHVRDTEGLTYGISSQLTRDDFTDGEWRISATFAPKLLSQGISSTMKQLTAWYDQGVTADELEKRKTNLVGHYKVALATTEGMAGSLLASVNRGVGPEWLDQYPGKINALTLPEVNGAIKKHLNPSAMVVIRAGTVPGAPPSPAKN